MSLLIGTVEALYRYPVKSMAGEALASAELGWHGVAGDRRLALRKVGDRGGFPWLTASRLPGLVCYAPEGAAGELPAAVRTPAGRSLEVFGVELAEEIGGRHGAAVEMTHLNRGIFDEASLSLIASATVAEVARLSGTPAEVRRFRPNILLASARGVAWEEEAWVGGLLTFGAPDAGPVMAVTNRDERCAMVNLEPDTARATPEVLRAIVAARGCNAGVYGAVVRRGRVAVGQPVYFTAADAREGSVT